MNTKKPGKKLTISKTTIANLEHNELSAVRGGCWPTAINTNCASWHPICITQPAIYCPPDITIEH